MSHLDKRKVHATMSHSNKERLIQIGKAYLISIEKFLLYFLTTNSSKVEVWISIYNVGTPNYNISSQSYKGYIDETTKYIYVKLPAYQALSVIPVISYYGLSLKEVSMDIIDSLTPLTFK